MKINRTDGKPTKKDVAAFIKQKQESNELPKDPTPEQISKRLCGFDCDGAARARLHTRTWAHRSPKS